MKKTFKQINRNGKTFNMLGLPNTNFFKFEIVNKYGSNIERIYQEQTGKNVYGISHFIEHLGFRSTKDFTTQELMKFLKNEGSYNASTSFDRIDYYFQTTMNRIDLGINLVCNYTLNPLDKISEEEFNIEKKVVINEAKRYADDSQTMFWFNSTPALCGYNVDDNIIGIPKTIETFTLKDCIEIKDIFLSSAENVYNVTFDSSVLTAIEVVEKIENELIRHKPLGISKPLSKIDYNNALKSPKNVDVKLHNKSEQSMTLVNLDVVSNIVVADVGNSYLSSYAEDTSLDDIIREQNGLTYGIYLYTSNIAYKPYSSFGCDVSKGDEELLMKLFKESVNKSVDNWNDDTYIKLMKSRKLKRTISLLDQKNYDIWHERATWYPEIIEELKDVLSEDLDKAMDIMDSKISTKDSIGKYLELFRDKVNSKDFGKVTN